MKNLNSSATAAQITLVSALNFALAASALAAVQEIFAAAVMKNPTAAAAQDLIQMKNFENLIANPFPVSISLDAPRIVFVISDLKEDPGAMEEDFRSFLAKTFQEEMIITLKRIAGFFEKWDTTTSPTILPAKIKWNLATFESHEANGVWTVTIKVPLF